MSNDPLDVRYEVVSGEPRWTAVGYTGLLRILIVTWTVRHEKVRVITARPAGKRLRNDYLRAKGLL